MKKREHAPSTHKVRRDLVGGKRGDGDKRTRAIRRPDPRQIRVSRTDPSLTAVAGLMMFGSFLRDLGVDRMLRQLFGDLKSRLLGIYPMEAQLRLLIDAFVAGEYRVFGVEGLCSAETAIPKGFGRVVPSSARRQIVSRWGSEDGAQQGELAMAKMCPISGCKSHKGMCIHDKLMVGMGALMMLGAIAFWGLHLI